MDGYESQVEVRLVFYRSCSGMNGLVCSAVSVGSQPCVLQKIGVRIYRDD